MEDGGLVPEIITKVGLAIKAFGLTLFAPFQWLIDWSPMLGVVALCLAVVVVASIVVRFLPDKLRGFIGYPVLGFIIWTAGRIYQFSVDLRARKQAEAAQREQERRKVAPPKPRDDGGLFGGWR